MGSPEQPRGRDYDVTQLLPDEALRPTIGAILMVQDVARDVRGIMRTRGMHAEDIRGLVDFADRFEAEVTDNLRTGRLELTDIRVPSHGGYGESIAERLVNPEGQVREIPEDSRNPNYQRLTYAPLTIDGLCLETVVWNKPLSRPEVSRRIVSSARYMPPRT